MIAIIRIRGTVNIEPRIKKCLETLGLLRPNSLALLPSGKQSEMMCRKAKDYATYGEAEESTIAELLEKRAEATVGGRVTAETLKGNETTFAEIAKKLATGAAKPKDFGIRNVFRLRPPSKGFERKGIKVPYSKGGALGNRGKEINGLIKRMS